MCDILADNTVMPVMFSDNNASYEISKHNNLMKNILKMNVSLFRPLFFYFLFLRFFPQKVRVGGGNKIKNKITVNNIS